MKATDYLKSQENQSLEQLKELLRIPTVSAQSKHKEDLIRGANWLNDYLQEAGIESKLISTDGAPLVLAEWHQSDNLPTVLIYGHYDVQPAEPFELWKYPPFEPTVENGAIFARGASDNKGQLFAHIKGVESYLKTEGSLPVNVKLLFEGEEEVESEQLIHFVPNNKEILAADIIVVSDSARYAFDIPSIDFGLRGIAALEIKVTGPDHDLHSGAYGGAVPNPINILAKMIAQLHDDSGRVLIDGFYDNVYTASQWERNQFASLPFHEEEHLASTGALGHWGEKNYSILERLWIRPTLDCNGISGGYQGEGGKTIIPSWASAKITMRLVPNMSYQEILDKTAAYLRKISPACVKLEIDIEGGGNPVLIPHDSPWIKAASKAIEMIYGKKPVLTKVGGSIPVIETFKSVLGIDTLLIGFGQYSDNVHSPNEVFSILDFHRGCQCSVALLGELAKVKVS